MTKGISLYNKAKSQHKKQMTTTGNTEDQNVYRHAKYYGIKRSRFEYKYLLEMKWLLP